MRRARALRSSDCFLLGSFFVCCPLFLFFLLMLAFPARQLREHIDDLAAVIVPAMRTHAVRENETAAMVARHEHRCGQRMMRPPHIPLRSRMAFLWYRHEFWAICRVIVVIRENHMIRKPEEKAARACWTAFDAYITYPIARRSSRISGARAYVAILSCGTHANAVCSASRTGVGSAV